MKVLKIAFAIMLIAIIGNKSVAQDSKLPYAATYSSHFTMGNQDYAAKILELWKDWDDNQLTRHDYFADTVIMFLPDGSVTRGKKVALDGAIKFRGSFTSVKSSIHAWIPLHSTDTNDDFVCVWGVESDTSPDGKIDNRELHEVWWFNKDGKISMMRQWDAKFGEPK